MTPALRRFPGTVAAAPLARQLAAAAVGLLALLGLLAAVAGVGVGRLAVGVLTGVVLGTLLVRATRRAEVTSFGPANLITLGRGVLVVGVASLVGTTETRGLVALTALTAVALSLDLVDGPVARRTNSVSALGARFDMETDAVLLLVLGTHVALLADSWLLAAGALALGMMRYVWVAAGWVLPWLEGELPVLRSAKVVAALQGVVLVVAATGLLPMPVERVAVAIALAALLWSFSGSVAYRWRAVDAHPVRWRALGATVLTTVATVLVLGVLVLPADLLHLVPAGFLRLPVEAIVGAAVLAVLPSRVRTPTALAAGALLGVVGLLKVLDIGFRASLARPFDTVQDWVLLGNAREYVVGTTGEAGATVLSVLAVLLVVGLLVGTAGAVLRLGRIVARHRRTTLTGAGLLAVVWLALWGLVGSQLVPGVPVAAADAVTVVREEAVGIPRTLRDREAFAESTMNDPYRNVPAEALLGALRGKDVVFVIVESYGRTALEDPEMAPRVGALLADGDRRLAANGFDSRTGFLTSPIAGGGSWFAHSTLWSGLTIDNQARYSELLASERRTLTEVFRDAGWETSAVLPGTLRPWPEGAFFGFERLHPFAGLGYAGPPFSWSPMPDQFALAAFERLERDRPGRGPVMSEIALTSSHGPWSPVPELVEWEAIGDGTVYGPMADVQLPWDAIWTQDPAVVRADYLRSTEYALGSVLAWLDRFGDDDLVAVVLGDHQPAPMVTGPDPNRDVPISIVTRDRAVLDRVEPWGWTSGLRPPPEAPVIPMADFRDRFLETFSD